MPDGFALAGDTSSLHIGDDIELTSSPREIERLESNHLTGLPPEILFDRSLIHNKLAFSGLEPNPCDGGFSLSGSIN